MFAIFFLISQFRRRHFLRLSSSHVLMQRLYIVSKAVIPYPTLEQHVIHDLHDIRYCRGDLWMLYATPILQHCLLISSPPSMASMVADFLRHLELHVSFSEYSTQYTIKPVSSTTAHNVLYHAKGTFSMASIKRAGSIEDRFVA